SSLPLLAPYTTLFRSVQIRPDPDWLAGGPRVRIDRSQRRPLRVEEPERRDARGVGEANQEPRLREGERPRDAVCGGVELHEVVRSEEHTSELQSPYDL